MANVRTLIIRRLYNTPKSPFLVGDAKEEVSLPFSRWASAEDALAAEVHHAIWSTAPK